MKIFSAFLLLASASVFANCPDLAGKYTCQKGEDTYQMTMTQTEQDGTTVYNQDTGEAKNTWIADGVTRPHTVTAEGQKVKGNIKITCSNSAVEVLFLANHMGMEIEAKETIKEENGELRGLAVANVDGREYSSDEYNCKRSN